MQTIRAAQPRSETRDYSQRNAYALISLVNAVVFGTIAMLIHPLAAVPTALIVFIGTFCLLCFIGAGAPR
jgi:hypothetical protein